MKTIETERLILRPWQAKDLDDLFDYKSDRRVTMSSSEYPHETKAQTKKLLDMMLNREGWFSKGECRAIVLKNENKVVGGISAGDLKLDESLGKKREIGFEINPKYWRMGIATEASNALIKHEFDEVDVDKVYMSHFSFNKKSSDLIKKLGFLYELSRSGKWRAFKNTNVQHMYYGLTREYWNKQKNNAK